MGPSSLTGKSSALQRGKRLSSGWDGRIPPLLRDLLPLFFFPVMIFYQEMVVKVWAFGTLFNRGTWFTLLFSAALGAPFFLWLVLRKRGGRA